MKLVYTRNRVLKKYLGMLVWDDGTMSVKRKTQKLIYCCIKTSIMETVMTR